MRLVSRATLMALSVAATLSSFPGQGVAQNAVTQQFNEVRDSLGLGETHAPIDFTERPPLVVPPTNNLPPPVGVDAKLPVVDPDVESRRKALSDPRRPVPPSDPGAAASGLSGRTYLIDPPAGMRNPDTVASEVTTDTAGSAATPTKRHRARRKARAASAAQ